MELCGENKIWNETDFHRFCCKEVLGSLLKVSHRTGMPDVARGWDASLRLDPFNPFTTQSYLDILQALAKYEARMGGSNKKVKSAY